MATQTAIRPGDLPYFLYDTDSAIASASLIRGSKATAAWPLPYLPTGSSAYSPDVELAAFRETNGLFVLGQNFPNPYLGKTTVPFTLFAAADVLFSVFDTSGRKMAGVIRKGLAAGEHRIELNLSGLNLPAGEYTYQLQVIGRYGEFRQRKTMRAQ